MLGAKLWDGAEGGAWKQGVTDIEGEVLCGEFALPSPSVPQPGRLALPWRMTTLGGLSAPLDS